MLRCVCKVHVYMFVILNVMKKNGEFYGVINLNAWLIKLDFCKIRNARMQIFIHCCLICF